MWVFFWFVMAMVVAVVASGKGRSGLAWFFYGLLIWPVALAHVCVLRRPEPARAGEVATATPSAPAADVPSLRPIDYVRPAISAGAGFDWSFRQSYRSKIRGVTKENEDGTPRQELIADLQSGDVLSLRREPANPFDANAIRVLSEDLGTLGYVGADLAATLAPLVDDARTALVVRVLEVTGGEQVRFLGVNFEIGHWEAIEVRHPTSRALTTISEPVVAELPDEAPPPAAAKISWVPAAAILATLVGGVWLFARVAATPADPAPAHAATAVRPPVSAPQMAALPPVVNPPTSEGGRRVLTREEIAVLQTTLNLVGFDVGSADGVVGPRTRAALREIERQAGWSQYAEPRAAHLQWAQSRLGRAGQGR